MSSESNRLQSLLGSLLATLGGRPAEIHRQQNRRASMRRELDGMDEEITADLEAEEELHARSGAGRIDVHQRLSESATLRRRARPGGRRLPVSGERRLPGEVEDEALDRPHGAELERSGGGVISYRRTVERRITIRGSFGGERASELPAALRDELGDGLEAPREHRLPLRRPILLPAASVRQTEPCRAGDDPDGDE